METQSEGTEGTLLPESPVEPSPRPEAVPAPPPARKTGVLGKILVGLLIFFLLAVAGGVGYWDYTLNTKLLSTNDQISTLQGKYETLQKDNKQLTSDLEKAKADLEKANGNLKKANDNAKDAQGKAKTVQTRIDATLQLLDIASSIFVDHENLDVVDKKVKATEDSKLIGLWEDFKSSGKQEDLNFFYDHLFATIFANLTEK